MPSRRSIDVVARALRRNLDEPVLVLLSPTRTANQVICFVFEGRDHDPTAVIRAMADSCRSRELVAELQFLDCIRGRTVGTALHKTLPAAPLVVDSAGDDVLIVEAYDPLSAVDGAGSPASSLAWLGQFQAHLVNDTRPLSRGEIEALLRRVETGWLAAGCADALPRLVVALEELASKLRNTEIPRCPVHGDFWRGNIFGSNGQMRIFDWEWFLEDGLPTFDLWTYVLADSRLNYSPRSCPDGALPRGIRDATAHLRVAGLPSELGTLTIAPTLADLALRGEERSGRTSDILEDRWLFDAVTEYVLTSVWASQSMEREPMDASCV